MAMLLISAAILPAAPLEGDATAAGEKQLPSFSLVDTDGHKHSLVEFTRQRRSCFFFSAPNAQSPMVTRPTCKRL
jgi:hypothetical protein